MPKILVADDNSNIQKMVALAFQDRGIEIVAVGNGEAAVRRLTDFEPDLILADIFMPVRSGYEVCEFVKKSERFSQTPVILLVGAFDPLDEKEARRVGADGVLKKPFIPPDPLIAMVMSALEKNPRVAAEMAKAKQAKETPEPHPIPQLEIPVRTAPKPLPTFPEPSPDEAALIYGFGSGRRALDDAGNDVTGAPEVATEGEDSSDAEFDAAATSRDWRRTAMDFEVPEADANRPAFSSDEELEPLTSPPSENASPANEVSIAQSESSPSPVIPEQAEALASTEVESASEPEVGSQELPNVPLVAVDQVESSSLSAQPGQDVLGASHWMDAVASTQTEYPQPQRNWLDALSAKSEETAIVSGAEVDSVSTDQISRTTVEQPELPVSGIESAEAAVEVVAAPGDHGVSASVEEKPQPWEDSSQSSAQPSSEDSFFVEEPEATATKESWFAPEQTAGQAPLAIQSEAVPSIAGRDDALPENGSLEPEPTDTNSLALRDPNLMESEAVRVTPEPLLVHDEPQEASRYGSPALQPEPKHSFFAAPVESQVTEDVAATQTPSHPDTWAQPFQSASDEIDERVPTMPPPNLEALAEIPFLTPPADLRVERREHSEFNPGMVDEIVRRVLESLEPRLHDLLAQEVLKPLVENILQSEMSKDVTAR